jgi:hypothetical protein
VAVLATSSAKADITYAIQNYTADQAGHTLSGQIITDGTLGDLSASAIKSWTVTISNEGTFSGDSKGVSISGSVMATATQITLDNPAEPTTTAVANSLTFTSGSFQLLYDQEWFQTFPGPPPVFDNIKEYVFADSTHDIWQTISPKMNGTEPWLIAAAAPTAVPEPSTAIVAVFGAVAFVAYGWSRHRREQRRQAAA